MMIIDLKDRGKCFPMFEVASSNNEPIPRKEKKMDGGLLKLSNQSNALHRERGGLELNNEGAKINKYKMGVWN